MSVLVCPECGEGIDVEFQVIVCLDGRGQVDGDPMIGVRRATCENHHDLDRYDPHGATAIGARLEQLAGELHRSLAQKATAAPR